MEVQSITEPLLDSAGAALILGKEPATLANWRTRKYGPRYIKLGSAVRYRPSDLDAWLRQQTVDPSTRAA